MGMHTLYGRGAVTVSDDRNTYVAHHGKLEVPDHLVPRVLALGFVRHAPDPEPALEPDPDLDAADDARQDDDAPPAIDASLTDEVLLAMFEGEALAKSYTAEAAISIALGRLAHLRGGGDGYSVLDIDGTNTPAADEATAGSEGADGADGSTPPTPIVQTPAKTGRRR